MSGGILGSVEYNAYRISQGTLAGVAIAVVGCVVLLFVLRRRTSVPHNRCIWIALSVASAVSVLLITLSPGRNRQTGSCEFGGAVFDWVSGNQSTANVAMLIPVAIALPLATRRTRWHSWSFAGLLLLPVMIEATQAVVPLGRACDGMDIVDNWFGVAFGCLLGWAGSRLAEQRAGTAHRATVEQELQVVARLFPDVLSGAKTSTIRWRESRIRPGLMRYVCAGDEHQTAIVMVVRTTDMPLEEAAAFLGRQDEWPPGVMLDGMREHYPAIELVDVVQVIEHLSPAESKRPNRRLIERATKA